MFNSVVITCGHHHSEVLLEFSHSNMFVLKTPGGMFIDFYLFFIQCQVTIDVILDSISSRTALYFFLLSTTKQSDVIYLLYITECLSYSVCRAGFCPDATRIDMCTHR